MRHTDDIDVICRSLSFFLQLYEAKLIMLRG